MCSVQSAPSNELETFLQQAHIEPSLLTEIISVVSADSSKKTWSGNSHGMVYSVCRYTSIPENSRLFTLRKAKLEIQNNLFVTQAILTGFQDDKLKNIEILKKAILLENGNLTVSGTGIGIVWETQISGNNVIGYAFAPEKNINSTLHTPCNITKIKNCYHKIIASKMEDAITKSQWNEALSFWNDLQYADLCSSEDFLNAALCQIKLQNNSEAIKLLQRAYNLFKHLADSHFYERIGDLYLEMKMEKEAQAAYEKATELFIKQQ